MSPSRKSQIDWALLVLRVAVGLGLFALHGWGKVKGAWGHLVGGEEWGFATGVAGMGFPFPRFFAFLSTLAESVGALLVAAGLWTRIAAAIVCVNMTVAVSRHLATDMRFELAALYLVVAVALVIAGAGRLSVDGIRR